MVEEAEQSLSEDLDHGALITDITQAAESDHLTQELQRKLETSDPPYGNGQKDNYGSKGASMYLTKRSSTYR